MKPARRSKKNSAMTVSTLCAFALFASSAPATSDASPELVGALHHGRLDGESIHWESQFVFEADAWEKDEATVKLLRPLSKNARVVGATLNAERDAITTQLTSAYARRGARSRIGKVSVFEPRPDDGQVATFAVPLAGIAVERITADGFKLEPTSEHNVHTYVGKRIASGVDKKARRRLERLARGAAPAGALYLGPSERLQEHGLTATFVDVHHQRRTAAVGFGVLGLGLIAALGAAIFALTKHAKREQSSAILDADLDELVEIAERQQRSVRSH